MKRIGFDEGETLNLSATWTFAAKEFIEKSGKKIAQVTPREWQEITAQASGYALGMHKGGTYAYQQGFISTITQFWSIQQKAISAMLPGAVGGSRAFTPWQKVGVALPQLALWGAGGLGIKNYVQDWLAQSGVLEGMSDKEAQFVTRLVANGAGEMLINHVLTESLGQTVDLNFGGTFSPAGAPVETVSDFFYTAFIDGGFMNALAHETAAGSTWGRFTDIAQFWRLTFNLEHRKPDDPSKLEAYLRSAPMMLSGYSNMVKALYALRTGQMITQYGDIRTNATYAEAVIRGTLGVQLNEEVDLRRLYGLNNRGFSFSEPMAKEVATELFRAVNMHILLFEKAGDTSLDRLGRAIQTETAIMQIFEEHEAEAIRREFSKLAKAKQNTPQDVFGRVYEMAFQGVTSPQHIINEVRTNVFANPEGEVDPNFAKEREALLRLLEGILLETGPLHRQIEDANDDALNRLGFYDDTEQQNGK